MLNNFILYTVNCIMYWRKLLDTTTFEPWTLNFWTFNFQTFYSKQTSRYIKFFHCFPKFDTRSDHYWTFLNVECWIWNDCSYTTTLNLEVFSDGWVIATKEQSYRSHNGKLEKPFIWLRFLHSAALQSKWQRRYLYLEYKKETINYYFKCWMIVHVQ